MDRRPIDRNMRDRGRDFDRFHHRHYRNRRDLDFDDFLRLLLLRQLLDGPEHDGDDRYDH
jgi:hypothetical protein